MSLSRTEKFAIKHQTKGLYRTMVMSALAMKEKYPGKRYYSDYAKMALNTRPKWTQISDEEFKHTGGLVILIKEKDSIVDAIHKILEVELVGGKLTEDIEYQLEVFAYAKEVLDKISK